MKLTGKTRFRSNWRGKLILQVEYSDCYLGSCPYDTVGREYTAWRDATLKDLCINFADKPITIDPVVQ